MISQEKIKLPWWKRILYSVLLSLISIVVLLGSFEFLFRCLGLGFDTSYYRVETDEHGVDWYRENRDFTVTFFSEELVRRPPVMKIPVEKGKNTYRIFVLGGSAAMGDPEASFSVSRTLQIMLEEAYPDIHFEVVNAAITAINSTVVKYVAQDCAKLEPDLFVVYVGNNEVIGPFGPASVFTPFMASPVWVNLTVALRKSKIGQVITHFIASSSGKNEWGGMQMFLDQSISEHDPRLKGVYRLYHHNLTKIVESASKASSDVLLCNVPTNTRDFAPFLTATSKGIPEQASQKCNSLVVQGDDALTGFHEEDALGFYRSAYEICPNNADIVYRIGRTLLSLNQTKEAKSSLERARDLDALRFRADSRLNEIVRNISEKKDCRFADLVGVAADHSQCGIPGNEFFYEHVHLSMYGTYYVACDLFRHVSDALFSADKIVKKSQDIPSYLYICKRLAYTPYDQGLITYELIHRFQEPPFVGQFGGESRLKEWNDRKNKISRLLTLPACHQSIQKMYADAINHSPSDWVLKRNYGMYLITQNKNQHALELLLEAYDWVKDDPDMLYALAVANKELENISEAQRYLGELREIEPRYPNLDLE